MEQKRMAKKILAIMLALALVLGMLPVNGLSAAVKAQENTPEAEEGSSITGNEEWKAEKLQEEPGGVKAMAGSDSFSRYTVEFTYHGLQYILPGDSSIELSEIMDQIGLAGEVSAVEISDESLFSAKEKDGRWIVTAHKAFCTDEWMKVTIDGVVYEITVTDTDLSGFLDCSSGSAKGYFTYSDHFYKVEWTGINTSETSSVQLQFSASYGRLEAYRNGDSKSSSMLYPDASTSSTWPTSSITGLTPGQSASGYTSFDKLATGAGNNSRKKVCTVTCVAALKPKWNWSADHSACTATFMCAESPSLTATVNATVTSSSEPFAANTTFNGTSYSYVAPVTYNITYILNGGTNAASNPATYRDDEIITLSDPTRTGYVFEGWYDNAGFNGTTVTGIPYDSSGNKTFYAKWKSEIDGLTYDAEIGGFVIDSAAALNTLASYSQNNNCNGMTFKQTADIALSGSFTGIGCYAQRFQGTYDGGNHYITGLYKKKYVNYLGLFLMTGGATIENVRLVSPTVDSSDTAGTKFGTGIGGLIGSTNNTTVRNCYVLDPALKGEGSSTGAVIGWKTGGSISDSFYYSESSTLPGVGRSDGTATRLRKLTLCDHVTASGDGVQLTYGGAIYCTENGAVTLTISTDRGYELSALSVKQGGTNVDVSGEGNTRTFNMPAGDVTVTAAFTRCDYTITYNGLDGANSVSNPASYNVESETITLVNPTRQGYAFEGWTGSNGTALQKTVTIPSGSTGDKTYTANWLADLWGIAQGNDGSEAHPYTISSPEGLILLASYVNSGRSTSGLRFVQTADIALDGKFTPIGGQNNGYNSTAFSGVYDGGGHTITGLTVDANSPYAGLFGYIQGGTVRNVTVISPNVRASYSNTRYAGGIVGCSRGYIENCIVIDPTLSATYKGAICGGITQAGRTITGCIFYATGNVAGVGMNNLKVPVTVSRVYTITTEGGITADANTAFSYGGTSYYTEGTDVTLGHNSAYAGYNFNYGGNVTVNDDRFSMPAKDVTLTAEYEPIVYSIVYHVDEAAAFSTTYNSYTVESEAISLDQPSRAGYTFVGWCDNEGLTGDPVTRIVKGSTGNVELWAKWRQNTYTIHFEPNLSVNGEMADQTFAYNQEETALTSNGFSSTIGEFLKWNTKPDGSGTDYINGAQVRNLTAVDGAVITLYAQWKLQHRIWYDSSIFKCVVEGNESRVYWANKDESVEVRALNADHVYTITVATADGEKIDYDNSTFIMPDKDVWLTTTSLTRIDYTQISLDGANPSDDVAYLLNAENPTVTPDIVVKYNDTTLTEGTDYSLSITNNTGSPDRMVEATVTVTGMGGYVGTKTTTFRITPFDIADCEIRGNLEIIDDGYGGLYPLMEKVQVWNGTVQLKGETQNDSANVDFTVEIVNDSAPNLELGEYTAYVVGRGDWGGKKEFSFEVIEPYHTVVFNANGGTGAMASDIVTKSSNYTGYTYTLPECAFTAPRGKEFDYWVASCEEGERKQPGNYFTAPYIRSESDVTTITVKAVWKDKTVRAVTASGLEHGSLLLNGEAVNLANDSIFGGDQITVVPDLGYTLEALAVTDAGSNAVTVENGVFTMPESNVTISATLVPASFNIVEGDSEHGSITVGGSASFSSNVTVTIAPEPGYAVSGVKYNGNDATKVDDTSYSFTMPAENVTISVEYTQLSYTLAASGLEHGALWVNGESVELPATVHCGDLVQFVPEKYYTLETLTYNVGESAPVNVGDDKFTMPAGNTTVTATLTAVPTYSITVVNYESGGEIEHGTVTPGQTIAAEGETIALTATPEEGYALDTSGSRLFILYKNDNGSEGTLMGFDRANLSFTMPGHDVTVYAQFISPWEQLQKKLNQGGTITLDRDYAATGTDYGLYVPENTTVTLDLNGHTLDASAMSYNVLSVYGALTLNDSKSGGKITGGKGSGAGVRVVSRGSFTMNDGEISGNTASGEYDLGGGVYVNSGSTFTMNGGTITGNSAPQGGGVYTFGTFTMNGGTITGNTAARGNGGGVMAMASFTISGTSRIDGNGADDVTLMYFKDEGEVCFDAKLLVGGKLTGAAQHPIKVRYVIYGDAPETLTFTSGLPDKGRADCFTSADTDCIVRLNGDGEAKLARRYAVAIDGSITGGSIAASAESPYEDDVVTLSAAPADGYALDSLIVTDANGDPVTIENNQFTMPAGNVTVSATFALIPAIAPTIAVNPANLSLTYGYTTDNVLTVTAENTDGYVLSYQWYSNTEDSNEGGTIIENATGASYTVPTGKNAGTTEYYYCVVTAARQDNGQTATAVSGVTVMVGKAVPSYTEPEDAELVCGQTLKDVTLPEGFSFADAEQAVKLGDNTVGLVYTPADTANYETVTGIMMKVTVSHSLTETAFQAADCEHAGNSAYWTCMACGKYFSDAQANTEIEKDAWVIPAPGHTPEAAVREKEVAATCDAAGSYDEVVYCAVCDTELSRNTVTVEALGHDYKVTYTFREDGKTCTAKAECKRPDCGAQVNGHIVTETVDTTAVVKTQPTKETKGVTTYTAVFENTDLFQIQTLELEDIPVLEDLTEAATEATTQSSTQSATEGKTEAATQSRTEAATQSRTEAATQSQTEAATQGKTEAATQSQTEAATQSRTEAATQSQTEAATQSRTEAATQSRTEAATQGRTEAATQGNTQAATEGKTEAATQGNTHTATECKTEPASEGTTQTGTQAATENMTEPATESETEAHVHTPAAAVREIEVAPTCDAEGCYDEVVYCSECGVELSRKTVTVEALGHDYEVTYTLSEDGKTCTAKAQCKRPECSVRVKGHIVTETADITAVVKTQPTKETMGVTAYTAVFENTELFQTQTFDVEDIPVLADSTEEATEGRTEAATQSSTQDTTEGRTEAATESSTQDTTEGRTEAATESSTQDTTEGRTEAATESSTQDTTEGRTEAATQSSTQDTTEGRTEAATESSTQDKTEGRTEAATESSTQDTTEGRTEAATEEPKRMTTESSKTGSAAATEQPAKATGTVLQDTAAGATYAVSSKSGETPSVEYKAGTNAGETRVEIPDTVTIDGVTYEVKEIAGDAFKDNKTVQSIVVSDNIETIGDNAFAGCTSLETVKLPESVTEIGDGAFRGCTSLKTVNLPNSVKEIGDNAFKGCASLKTVSVPNSVKEIGDGAFSGCSSLKKIAVPDSVTEIGDGAFNGCKKLTNMNVGKNVKKVGDGAFANCTSMKTVTLSAKTNTLGKQVFKGSRKLKTITIKSKKLTAKTIAKNAFKGVSDKVTIKVPKGKKKAYTALFRKKGLSKKVKIK